MSKSPALTGSVMLEWGGTYAGLVNFKISRLDELEGKPVGAVIESIDLLGNPLILPGQPVSFQLTLGGPSEGQGLTYQLYGLYLGDGRIEIRN